MTQKINGEKENEESILDKKILSAGTNSTKYVSNQVPSHFESVEVFFNLGFISVQHFILLFSRISCY
jgi:hypothetical protein